jgi:outer membrane protein assembly factor BamE (lipoprotein component of BamABCDE complex)
LLIQLKEKIKSLDEYNSRLIINKKMESARSIIQKGKEEKLKVGQTIPQVQNLLGEPHEKIISRNGQNFKEQLWIYFMNEKSLNLTFIDFILFRIEQL